MPDLTTRLSLFLSTLAGSVSVPGVVSSQITSTGNTDSSEDDLLTYSLPANTLSANGKGLRVNAWGTFAGNANVKTLNFYFGSAKVISTAIVSTPTANLQTSQWNLEVLVIRLAASSQNVIARFTQMRGGTADIRDIVMDHQITALTQDETAAITVKATGTATTANDIIQSGMLIEALL